MPERGGDVDGAAEPEDERADGGEADALAGPVLRARTAEEIEDAFNPAWHLKHVDTIFAKLGLNE